MQMSPIVAINIPRYSVELAAQNHRVSSTKTRKYSAGIYFVLHAEAHSWECIILSPSILLLLLYKYVDIYERFLVLKFDTFDKIRAHAL
jgi:hypothetical protein